MGHGVQRRGDSDPAQTTPTLAQWLAPRGVLVRWVLLVAVLAGVLGLHVLTVEHGDHGDLPSTAVLAAPAAVDPAHQVDVAPQGFAAQAAKSDAPALPADAGTGWLAGCVFLAVAAAALGLLVTARSRRGDPTSAGDGVAVSVGRPQRAVPGAARLVLCVHRV